MNNFLKDKEIVFFKSDFKNILKKMDIGFREIKLLG